MDPMRRYGIPGLDAALAKLDDHDQLERERSPFSLSPASFQSGSTGFDDPNMPEPDPLAARKIKLEFAHRASLPSKQFKSQVDQEKHRLLEKHPDFMAEESWLWRLSRTPGWNKASGGQTGIPG